MGGRVVDAHEVVGSLVQGEERRGERATNAWSAPCRGARPGRSSRSTRWGAVQRRGVGVHRTAAPTSRPAPRAGRPVHRPAAARRCAAARPGPSAVPKRCPKCGRAGRRAAGPIIKEARLLPCRPENPQMLQPGCSRRRRSKTPKNPRFFWQTTDFPTACPPQKSFFLSPIDRRAQHGIIHPSGSRRPDPNSGPPHMAGLRLHRCGPASFLFPVIVIRDPRS
jgi:hypothetical protein